MGYEKGERGGDVFMLTLLLRASYVCYSPFSFFVVGSRYVTFCSSLLLVLFFFYDLVRFSVGCGSKCWSRQYHAVCEDPLIHMENPFS